MDRGIIFCPLIFWCLSATCCFAEKLSVDQKAPLFARGSGGLILAPPFEGPKQQASASPSVVNGVQREEKESYKVVDGQVVRVVEGSFSYKSPEGIPVAVMYTADENGNRASFRLGTAAGSGGGGPSGASGGRPGTGNQGNKPGGGGPASDTYLPPKNDRMYLPPN